MKHSDYPALYQSASALSQRAQSSFYRAFLFYMGLLVIASAISVINSSSPEVAILQAMVLLGALGCALFLYLSRPDRNWYAGRAVTESIKTITWRFISKSEPFNHSDKVDRHDFGLKLKAIVDQNKGVAGLLTTHLDKLQITPEMERLRQASLIERQDYYRTHRIDDQRRWYADKAGANRRLVDRFFWVLFVIIGMAIFFAVAKVSFPTTSIWPTDFFVTVAAALLSWIQAKRFQELSASYALAAHEISLIRQQADNQMNDDEFSQFVGDAESAFSREHTQWIARRDS